MSLHKAIVTHAGLLMATESGKLPHTSLWVKNALRVEQRCGYVLSCDPDVQYNIALILQSDWTSLYAGTLHKLIYGTFPTRDRSNSPGVISTRALPG